MIQELKWDLVKLQDLLCIRTHSPRLSPSSQPSCCRTDTECKLHCPMQLPSRLYTLDLRQAVVQELKCLQADEDLTSSSSSVSNRLVRWSTASSMSESSSRPGGDELLCDLLSASDTYFPTMCSFTASHSPFCCASSASTDVAVTCRLALVSTRAEKTMLHRDGRKAAKTFSSAEANRGAAVRWCFRRAGRTGQSETYRSEATSCSSLTG